MSTIRVMFRFAVVCFALGLFTGCGSTSGGGSSSSSVGVYYGVGFYDPWSYGDYDQDIDITLPDRPDRPNRPVHPEQPIARPPGASARPYTASSPSAARPMPSIPSTPKPAPRGGGGGRR